MPIGGVGGALGGGALCCGTMTSGVEVPVCAPIPSSAFAASELAAKATAKAAAERDKLLNIANTHTLS